MKEARSSSIERNLIRIFALDVSFGFREINRASYIFGQCNKDSSDDEQDGRNHGVFRNCPIQASSTRFR
ncbi:hypothetical protein L2E82_25509 [Cichorium intybus]|uniref:Uncharacterized protein n=1 Tax=Cichorium intybus TaxID=13427 RepID=A0ACB9E404_CICIN|nr:hypothetical protein L2E82_25509 [Cichorium intybus]